MTDPRPQPEGVRAVIPGQREASTPFEDAGPPDERSGVRILRPEDRSGEARRLARQAPLPTGEPEATIFDEEDEEPPHRVIRDRVLGVNFAGDVAHLAVVEPPDRAVLDIADQLTPTGDTDHSRRLADFGPLRYTNWTYANAFERVSLETCLMLEANRLELRFESVGQHHAANVVGLPAQQLTDSLPARLRIPKTADWPNRYPAILVALAVALEM